MRKPSKNILALLSSIVIAQSAGLIGSLFTFSSVDSWYLTLNAPTWNPPSWVFGPVWTSLYTLIGISAYLIWKSKKSEQRTYALKLYGLHLILNALWSILFFGLQNPGLAFLEILILLSFIFALLLRFWPINKWASIVLTPYLLWVSFASVLNFTIWQLN